MTSGAGGRDLSDSDYEAIEAAVMETERGRWFLAEHAKRHRTADTEMLLEALTKLEQAVADLKPMAQTPHSARPQTPVAKFCAQDEDIFAASPAPKPPPVKLHVLPPETAPPATEKKRVVIIRRAASDAVDIPLMTDSTAR